MCVLECANVNCLLTDLYNNTCILIQHNGMDHIKLKQVYTMMHGQKNIKFVLQLGLFHCLI